MTKQQSDCAPSTEKALVLSYPLSAWRRLWSDWADAQANLSLLWAHIHVVAQMLSETSEHFLERPCGECGGLQQDPRRNSSAWWYEPPHDKTNKMSVRPAKTKMSLGIRPVWPESSLCAQWVAKDPSFLHADSEDSDQTGWMPRLIWVFAGRTFHFVGFVMRRLIS